MLKSHLLTDRALRMLCAVGIVVAAFPALAAGAPSAGAGGNGGVDDQVGGSAGKGQIAVKVTLSGTALGNGGTSAGGGGASGGVTTVYTPPACYWDSLDGAYTGTTMWARLQSDPKGWYVGDEANYLPSMEQVKAHKDDDGVWYTIAPGPKSNVESGVNGGVSWDKVTGACMTTMRKAAGPGANGGNAGYIFVPPGAQPPAPLPAPPTPEQMRDAALSALTLPTPELGHNPGGQTLVRLPTWFWVPRGDFRTWDITASAGIAPLVVSATVTATPATLAVSSAGGSSNPCTVAQATAAWTAGASDDSACTVSFVRSSVGQPGLQYDVTGTTAYTTGWTSRVGGAAGPGGALIDQTRTGQVQVPVAEVQALVQDKQ